MKRSYATLSSNFKVFTSCLLSLLLLVTQIATAATEIRPDNGWLHGKRADSTLEDLFIPAAERPMASEGSYEMTINSSDGSTDSTSQLPAPPASSLAAPLLPVVSAAPAPVPVVGSETATLAAALVATANNGDGKADPGDTINYTVTVGNQSASDATAVGFSVPLDSHIGGITLGNGTPISFDLAAPAFNEDASAQTITLQGQDPDGTSLTFNIVSGQGPTKGTLDTTNINSVTCTNGVCSASITYTPNANANGSDSFKFRVNDGLANSNEDGTVSLTINAVNDAPTFTAGGNQTSAEDAGVQSVSNFATNIKPGPATATDETGQTVSFEIVSNNNTSLFSTQPAIDSTGKLIYTAGPDKNGTATITYHAKDSGGTANGGVDTSSPDQQFTITITPVNDKPIYTGAQKTLTMQSHMKLQGATGLLTGVTDPDANDPGFSPQTLQVDPTTIDTTNCKSIINAVTYPCLITVTDVSAGTFNIDPPPGVGNGTVLSFTYKVKDNGNPAPGILSDPISVNVTVQGPIIWFVDPNAASNGIGTLSSPFKNLATAADSFHMGNLGSDQRVFVYSGQTEAGVGITLSGVLTSAGVNQASARTKAQWLVGQGVVGPSFDTVMGINPPTGTINRPTISSMASTANGLRPIIRGTVTMKENTFLTGVNINTSAGSSKGLTNTASLNAGTSGSTVDIKDVSVTTAGGNAVDFSNAQTVNYTTSDGTNSPNNITSTTGIALNVVSTTIGSGGFNFKSISANGGTNGIVLNNTGSTGSLIVAGGGNTSQGGDASGGTIQNTSGAGIALTSTRSPSFNNIKVLNTTGSGIEGTAVTNFTLTYSNLTGNGSTAATDTSNVAFNDTTTVNVSGTVTITNNILNTAVYHGVDIFNVGGTISDANISNNQIISSTSGATSLGSGIRLISFGNASVAGVVTKATIDSNDIQNFPSAAGIVVQSGNSNSSGAPATTMGVAGHATNKINITNNKIKGQSAANRMGVNAILALVNGVGQGNFNISNNGTVANPITNVTGNVISHSVLGLANVTTTIANNVIVANHTAGVGGALGISTGVGKTFSTNDTASLTISITGNNVSQTDANGILARAVEAKPTMNITVKNNTVAAPLSGVRPGIRVDSGDSASNSTVCLDMQSNTSAGSGGSQGLGLRRETTNTNVYGVKGMAATSSPGVESYVNGLNPSGGGTLLISGTTGFSNCSSSPISSITRQNTRFGDLALFNNLLQTSPSDSTTISEETNSADESAHAQFVTDTTQTAQSAIEVAVAQKPALHDTILFAQTNAVLGMSAPDPNSVHAELAAVATNAADGFSNIATTALQGEATMTVQASEIEESATTQATDYSTRIEKAYFQPMAVAMETGSQAGGVSGEDVSLSHGGSKGGYLPSLLPLLAPAPPLNSISWNGTGSGFRLPVGKTTTLKFSVTVANPPEMMGVTPPKISEQGTLQGSFGTIVTDDPSTVGTPNDATVTLVDLFNTTSTITGASPSNSTSTGQAVTLTASIVSTGAPAPAGGTLPAGTATFKDNGTDISGCVNVTVTSGSAQCTTSALTTGTHNNITVVYSGDGNFDPSTSAAFTQTITQSGTSVTVTSSLNPSLATQNVTFTATVASTGGNSGPPTGTVTFKDGANPITCSNAGGQTLSGGVATCQIATLAAGNHNITAVYGGDTNFTGNTGTLTGDPQVVNKSGTTVTLGTSGSPTTPGTTVTFTATINSSTAVTANRTGTVTFYDGANPITCDSGQTLGSGTPGVATCQTNDLTEAGSPHSITAVYAGDNNFGGSTSNTVDQVVTVCNSSVVVTNTNDSGSGSLREAIITACADSNITFNIPTDGSDTGYDSGTGVTTITLTSGELLIDRNLTITGLGADKLIVKRSTAGGTPRFRIFTIAAGSSTVNITGMTINNGRTADGTVGNPGTDAGGILNNAGATLNLKNVAITGNNAGTGGANGAGGNAGGIKNLGTLNLTNSTISGNTAGTGGSNGSGGNGGGLYNSGTATLTNTTVSGNNAGNSGTNGAGGNGGGIFNAAGTLNLVSSTISNNTTGTGNGAGTGGTGGGVFLSSGTVNVKNTIIAGNTFATGGSGADGFGIFTSQDYNLYGTLLGIGFTTVIGSHDLHDVSANLGTLGNNGGPTQTMLPLPGSPALNAIPVGNLSTDTQDADSDSNVAEALPVDQRGFTRVVGTNFDIGAVEANYSIAATAGTPQSAVINTAFGTDLQATVKESNIAKSGITVTFTAGSAGGATGSFAGNVSTANASTNGSGIATAPIFTANGTTGGPYNVTASLGTGLPTTTFALSNTKATQTIIVTGHAPATAVFNTTFTVAATAGSGLGVVYGSSGACTNVGALYTMTSGTGTCTVTYDQPGDSNYDPAPQVVETVTAQKAGQTITFGALANKTFGDADFNVSATASSNLAVSFNASGNCTVAGTLVHLTGAGSCTITVSHAGDSNFDAAPDVSRSFNIAKAATTTSVTVSGATYDGNPHGGKATVTGPEGLNQGLTVTYSGRNGTTYGPSATAPTGAGDYTASAAYAGDSNYNSSSDSKDYSISKVGQSISFGALGDKTYGDADFTVSATASSGLAVSFAASGGCTVAGNAVHITGAGSCTITASQPGSGNFDAALDVQRTFNIGAAATTTSVSSSANPSASGQSVTLTATVTSAAGTPTGTVQFKDGAADLGSAVNLNAGGVATLSTNTLAAGNHNITVVYSGDSNFQTSIGTLSGGQQVNVNASVSISDVSLAEGNSGTTSFAFTLSLLQASNLTVKVDFATANGTATAGSDYVAQTGTVTFAPGETQKTITVAVSGDTGNEADETFFVNLLNPQNATISDNQGLGTILNDDLPGVQLSSSSYTVNEGLNNTAQGFTSLSVDVVRTGDLSQPMTVKYSTSDQSGGNECNQVTGFASQRCDYTLVGATLRFVAGEATKQIQIPITNDGHKEGDEIFSLQLQNPVGATLGSITQATITIQDDAADAMPTTPAQNPYLNNAFFVRQDYLDNLGRDADQNGFNDWLNVLNTCGPQKGFLGAPFNCDRAHVAHGFFGSPEFTQSGFLLFRLYAVGRGRLPLYSEFVPDMATLSGFGIPDSVKQQNLADYLQQFASDAEFTNRFQSVSQSNQAEQLIAFLEQTSGVTLPATATTLPGQPTQYGRSELIQKRASGQFSLIETIKAFVEQKVVYDRYFTEGEVTMMYFVYLRRDPSLNDPNLLGWKDWVNVFTNGGQLSDGTVIQPRDIHHLIFGFIYSTEYRKRFGAP